MSSHLVPRSIYTALSRVKWSSQKTTTQSIEISALARWNISASQYQRSLPKLVAMANSSQLEQRLQGLKNSRDASLDPMSLLQAFREDSCERARALATIALSRIAANEPGALASSLEQFLCGRVSGTIEDQRAILRLMATVSLLSPTDGMALLFVDALADHIFPKIDASSPALNILRAEIAVALSNHAQARAKLLAGGRLLTWLLAASNLDHSEVSERPLSERRVALVALLALYKLYKGSTGEGDELDALQQSARTEWTAQEPRREDELYKLSRQEILDATEQSFIKTESRISLLAALESLSYITASTTIKNRLASDARALLCLLSLHSTLGQGAIKRSVFPERVTEQGSSTGTISAYNLDPYSSTKSDRGPRAHTSVEFALSTIILNLVAYPPLLSDEEQKVKQLRNLAATQKSGTCNNSSRSAAGPAREPAADDESDTAVNMRIDKVVRVGGIKTLVQVTFSGSSSAGASQALNTSRSVKDAVSSAFYHLTRSNDKKRRGEIAQAGGVKALLALSSDALGTLLSSRVAGDDQFKEIRNVFGNGGASKTPELTRPLEPLQALSRLCITASPAILFGSSTTAVSVSLPFLTTLFLHRFATSLQRFEALLALTNVASLSTEAANAVAKGKMKAELDAVDASVASDPTTIANGMEQAILIEENHMVRRAAVELLCNLVQSDEIFKRWTGEEELVTRCNASTGGLDSQSDGQSRARKRLHLLVALCAPGIHQSTEGGRDTSISTRMASAGALAMLSSSPVACGHLMALKPETLNILARLIVPGTIAVTGAVPVSATKYQEIPEDKKPEEDDISSAVDEEEEARLDALDAQSWSRGAAHARASILLRGVTIARCLGRYISWKKPFSPEGSSAIEKLIASGITAALQTFAVEGTREMQDRSASTAEADPAGQEAKGMRTQATQLAVEALKAILPR